MTTIFLYPCCDAICVLRYARSIYTYKYIYLFKVGLAKVVLAMRETVSFFSLIEKIFHSIVENLKISTVCNNICSKLLVMRCYLDLNMQSKIFLVLFNPITPLCPTHGISDLPHTNPNFSFANTRQYVILKFEDRI